MGYCKCGKQISSGEKCKSCVELEAVEPEHDQFNEHFNVSDKNEE